MRMSFAPSLTGFSSKSSKVLVRHHDPYGFAAEFFHLLGDGSICRFTVIHTPDPLKSDQPLCEAWRQPYFNPTALSRKYQLRVYSDKQNTPRVSSVIRFLDAERRKTTGKGIPFASAADTAAVVASLCSPGCSFWNDVLALLWPLPPMPAHISELVSHYKLVLSLDSLTHKTGPVDGICLTRYVMDICDCDVSAAATLLYSENPPSVIGKPHDLTGSGVAELQFEGECGDEDTALFTKSDQKNIDAVFRLLHPSATPARLWDDAGDVDVELLADLRPDVRSPKQLAVLVPPFNPRTIHAPAAEKRTTGTQMTGSTPAVLQRRVPEAPMFDLRVNNSNLQLAQDSEMPSLQPSRPTESSKEEGSLRARFNENISTAPIPSSPPRTLRSLYSPPSTSDLRLSEQASQHVSATQLSSPRSARQPVYSQPQALPVHRPQPQLPVVVQPVSVNTHLRSPGSTRTMKSPLTTNSFRDVPLQQQQPTVHTASDSPMPPPPPPLTSAPPVSAVMVPGKPLTYQPIPQSPRAAALMPSQADLRMKMAQRMGPADVSRFRK